MPLGLPEDALLSHPLGEIQGYLCHVLLAPVPAHSIPWLVHRLGRHMELVFMIQLFCGRAWTCAIYWKPLGDYQNLIGKVWHLKKKKINFQPLLSNDLFAVFINTVQCHWGGTGTGMNWAGLSSCETEEWINPSSTTHRDFQMSKENSQVWVAVESCFSLRDKSSGCIAL